MEKVHKGVVEPTDSDLKKLYKTQLYNKDRNVLLSMRHNLTERLLTNSSTVKKEIYPCD